jgi:methanogenic corrinoid protein MtbC1
LPSLKGLEAWMTEAAMTDPPEPPQIQAGEWLAAARAEILSHLATAAGTPSDADPAGGLGGGGQEIPDGLAEALLDALVCALSWDNEALFADSVGWAMTAADGIGFPGAAARRHLRRLAALMRLRLPGGAGLRAGRTITNAMQAEPGEPMGTCREDPRISLLAALYFRALLRGDRHLASRLVLHAVEHGATVRKLYLGVFQPALHEIGRLWQLNRISVAEEHYCTAATQLVMSQLYPHIFSSGRNGRTVVVACVSGDLHELGARMVADFFEMDGWDSYYTGASTPLTGVVRAVAERHADVLAVSATITQHVPEVRRLIGLVRSHPGCGRVNIIVGGHPFNRDPSLWREVGADGTGLDAHAAVETGNSLARVAGAAVG